MDKKKLKDIILKTLEKEGGAAGLKALAKAAKTSKGKLKKDLSKMSGVKQHQDGDYISTPIDEVQMATSKCKKDSDCRGTAICVNGFCLENPKSKKPMTRKPMRLREAEPLNEAQLVSSESGTFIFGPPLHDPPKKYHTKCTYGDGSQILYTNNPPCPDHPNGAAPGDLFIPGPSSDFKRPDKKLREVKEIIKVMLDEKEKKCKCKNGVCITAGGDLCPSHECGGACRGSDSKLKEINPLVKMGKKAFGKLATKIFGSPADYSNAYYEQLNEIKDIIEVMLDEKKKKKKDRCHRKADQVYGTKTSAYKSGAIVKCRKGMIWKKK